MRRILWTVALLVILVAAPAAARSWLPVGTTLRIVTVRPHEDPSGAFPAGVVSEDENSITFDRGPGEPSITWTKEGRGLIGRLTSADERRLTLRVQGRRDSVSVLREDVDSMAFRRGRSRGRGAMIGAVVGAGIGAFIGYASRDNSPSIVAFTGEGKAMAMAVRFAPIGALIGLALPPAERWEEVPPHRVRLGVAVVPGSHAAVAVRIAF